jgi:hypothetical protein
MVARFVDPDRPLQSADPGRARSETALKIG